ncbi:MAG: hypothetical protein ACLPJJ_03990 [Acidocella sp.]|uniref:hypothetical protein n=1 Tax=Acidocella sp. TaxID=50710 RepID=UPI003FC72974
MPNKNQAGATGAPPVALPFPQMTHGGESVQPMPEVAAAVARLRADVDRLRPDRLDETYALLDETRRDIIKNWRGHPRCQAMLEALRRELIALVDEYHEQADRALPVNGYMFGMSEDAMRCDTQADMMLDEAHQLEAAAVALSRLRH